MAGAARDVHVRRRAGRFAREALPHLVRAGFTATLFVVAGRIGGETDWRGWPPDTSRERLLDAAALAEVAAAGVEIGAHAVSHLRLSTLGADAARREVLDGRRRLEDLLSRPVRSFAYPFGDVTPAMARLVRERFEAGFGIRLAYASPRSRLEAFERIDAYYAPPRVACAALGPGDTRTPRGSVRGARGAPRGRIRPAITLAAASRSPRRARARRRHGRRRPGRTCQLRSSAWPRRPGAEPQGEGRAQSGKISNSWLGRSIRPAAIPSIEKRTLGTARPGGRCLASLTSSVIDESPAASRGSAISACPEIHRALTSCIHSGP